MDVMDEHNNDVVDDRRFLYGKLARGGTSTVSNVERARVRPMPAKSLRNSVSGCSIR